MNTQSYRLRQVLMNFAVYFVLTFFALVMIFPFLYMLTTSFKIPSDTFRYPPRMLPRDPVEVTVDGYEESLPLYYVDVDGQQKQYALAESNIKVGVYAPPDHLESTVERYLTEVKPTGGAMNPQTVIIDGEEQKLFDVNVDGQIIPMVLVSQTTVGEFIDPQNAENKVYRNVRLSEPVENVRWHPENYREVIELNNMSRALTNTALVTILVVLGNWQPPSSAAMPSPA